MLNEARTETNLGVRICSVPGCGRKHQCKGFCKRHYNQHVRKATGNHQGGTVTVALREQEAFLAAERAKRLARIDKLIRDGLPAEAIAERMGMDAYTIRQRSDELGVKLPSFVEWNWGLDVA